MAAVDNFATHNVSLGAPAVDAFAITPNDGTDLSNVTRYIYVGGAGAIALITVNGETVTFSAVPVGTVLPIRAARVKATGTTATLLIGMY